MYDCSFTSRKSRKLFYSVCEYFSIFTMPKKYFSHVSFSILHKIKYFETSMLLIICKIHSTQAYIVILIPYYLANEYDNVMLQGQYQNDLKGLMFHDISNSTDEPTISGEFILENIFQIDTHRSKWVDLSVIFSMIIIYRFIFFIIIKANEDVTPLIRAYIARQRMQRTKSITYNNNHHHPRHVEISLSPTPSQDLHHPSPTDASSTSDSNNVDSHVVST